MKIMVWADNDLDGAGSAMLIKHAYKTSKVDIKTVYRNTFSGDWMGWYKDIDKYDRVFILDTCIPDNIVESVDNSKVLIIDHHISHIDAKRKYKNAKAILKPCTSTVKLIQETLLAAIPDTLTDAQKLLFTYIDDYDSYTLKYAKETMELNIIFGTCPFPRIETFIERWSEGIREYTLHEKNSIVLWVKQFKDQLERVQVFKSNAPIKGYNVISCFSEFAPNEIATKMLNKYKADIVFVINLETKKVSLRKARGCDAKLHVWAEVLCEGGGHEYAAGGILTEKLMNLSSQFSPC